MTETEARLKKELADHKEKEIALLETLQDLVQNVPMPEVSLRVAVGLVVAPRMHELTGVPLISPGGIEWGIARANELNLIKSTTED